MNRRFSVIPKDTEENMKKWREGWQRRCKEKEEAFKKERESLVGEWGSSSNMEDVNSLPLEDREELWKAEVMTAASQCRTLKDFDSVIEARKMRFPFSPCSTLRPADPRRKTIFDFD